MGGGGASVATGVSAKKDWDPQKGASHGTRPGGTHRPFPFACAYPSSILGVFCAGLLSGLGTRQPLEAVLFKFGFGTFIMKGYFCFFVD